jgi:hypothetical protein
LASALRRHERRRTRALARARDFCENAATLGLTDLSVLDDEKIRLNEADSRVLCDAANLHLAQDGVVLRFIDANQWLVEIAQPIDVITEHPMFIVGENMRQFLPRGRDARMVERWMNELQMLLFNHPVNDTRQSNRLPPINVVWLHSFSSSDAPMMNTTPPTVLFGDALRRGDVAAWQAAWGSLESEFLQADEIVLGDASPRVHMRCDTKKNRGLFSWFMKRPTLTGALTHIQSSAQYG